MALTASEYVKYGIINLIKQAEQAGTDQVNAGNFTANADFRGIVTALKDLQARYYSVEDADTKRVKGAIKLDIDAVSEFTRKNGQGL